MKTLYHGTNGDAVQGIAGAGLRVSTGGNARIGDGVYFTDDYNVAKTIAAHRGNACVLTCRVDLGSVYDHDKGGSKSWANDGYQSSRGTHPDWAGVGHTFTEYCVDDAQRVQIVEIHGAYTDRHPKCTGTHKDCGVKQCQGLSHCVAACRACPDAGAEGKEEGNEQPFSIVNVGHNMFLDSHGEGVWLWGDGHTVGKAPENIQWRLVPVDGAASTYYVVNVAHSKFLDSHGKDVWLWGDGKDVGKAPENIQWRIFR